MLEIAAQGGEGIQESENFPADFIEFKNTLFCSSQKHL